MANIAERVFLVSLLGVFVFTCTGKLVLKNVLSYKTLGYTKYQSWNLRGELRFVFKTTQKNGLLAYQDDGEHNFIEISLVESNAVRLKAGLGSCDIREIFVRQSCSDGLWHQVRIKSHPKNFTIFVDDKAAWIPCGPLSNQKFKYGGNFLYVANFPLTVELNALVFPGAFHEAFYYSFQGCIGDVKFTNYKGKLLDAAIKATDGVSGCVSACATPHVNRCQHRGKCVDDVGRVECECTGTGYEGALCSKPSSSMWLNGSGYILYDVGTHQPGRSTVGNNIAFRFATTNPRGVVMLTDIADDHVIVELVNGFLRVSWDLGQGGLVLMSRQGCLNDAVWHAVSITRIQRRIKITIDDQRPIHAAIPGMFSFLDFKGGKEQMLFGGGPLTKAFNRSLSRTNFTGFLQQFQFDEFDVIDETILEKAFMLLGNGVLNASSLFDLIPASPSSLANCSREVDPSKEGHCSEGVDDEDLCESGESGDGQLTPDCEGNCASTTPDSQQVTDGPSSAVPISANHNSTSVDVRSANTSSTGVTPLNASINVTSKIQPSLSRSTNMTEAISTAVVSPNKADINASIYNSSDKVNSTQSESISSAATGNSESTQTVTMATKLDRFPTSTTRMSKISSLQTIINQPRVTPSQSASTIESGMKGINETNSLLTLSKSTLTRSTLNISETLSTIVMHSGSVNLTVDNNTVLAYRNGVCRTTANPTWLVGLIFVMLRLY